MAKFAVVQNNVVTNVIIADSKEIAEDVSRGICIESDIAGIGWIYNEDTEDFVNPIAVETPTEDTTA